MSMESFLFYSETSLCDSFFDYCSVILSTSTKEFVNTQTSFMFFLTVSYWLAHNWFVMSSMNKMLAAAQPQ